MDSSLVDEIWELLIRKLSELVEWTPSIEEWLMIFFMLLLGMAWVQIMMLARLDYISRMVQEEAGLKDGIKEIEDKVEHITIMMEAEEDEQTYQY